MPPITLLIKPSSSACNMKCTYCFYNSIATERNESFLGMMSFETTEKLIQSAFSYAGGYAEGSVVFAFQGGEPTLAGIEYFKAFIELQKKYNKNNVKVFYSIQTNGYLVDEEFAKFFKQHNFLVGISFDGPAEFHNLNRVDINSKGTYNNVIKAISLLKKHNVEFNILSVVTGKNATSIHKIYNFFKKSGYNYLQFIPCLEPLCDERGQNPYHLSTKAYAEYLKKIFDLFYNDFIVGRYISIRHIDNIINLLMGRPTELCSMRGVCSVQFVVEGDGSVYPCDFYAYDQYKIGNIGEMSFEQMLQSDVAKKFIEQSINLPDDCKKCEYLSLCRNGCRRDRDIGKDQHKNYYCEAYKQYFKYMLPKAQEILKRL